MDKINERMPREGLFTGLRGGFTPKATRRGGSLPLVWEDKAHLCGILATVCPADKKVLREPPGKRKDPPPR